MAGLMVSHTLGTNIIHNSVINKEVESGVMSPTEKSGNWDLLVRGIPNSQRYDDSIQIREN